jgi:hypothetical protein
MDFSKLHIQFVPTDDINYFDLIPCLLIVREIEQKIEPVENTLRWIRGEGFEGHFLVSDDERTYDISELLKQKRERYRHLSDDEVQSIRDALATYPAGISRYQVHKKLSRRCGVPLMTIRRIDLGLFYN